MRHLLVLAAFIGLASTGTACKKKGGGGAGSAASSAKPVVQDPCPAGAYKAPSGAFCLDAQGFKPSDEQKDDPNTQVDFTKSEPDGNDLTFHVYYAKDDDHGDYLSSLANYESTMKGKTVEGTGELGGGVTGKFYEWADGDAHHLEVEVRGTANAYTCEATHYKTPIDPSIVTACKSLHALQ